MKKIIIINWRDIKNPRAGGAEVYYYEIFKRLAQSKTYAVTVLSHAFKGCSPHEISDDIVTIRIGNEFLFNYSVIGYLLKHQSEYDLIIEDINKLPFFTPLYSKKPRMHMVMHFFGTAIFQEAFFPMALYVFILESLVRFVYKREYFLGISNSTTSEINRFAKGPIKTITVEPGIDGEFFKPFCPKDPTPLLFCITRLQKYKNVQFLISNFKPILAVHPDAKLIIAGNGPYKETLQSLVCSLTLTDSVSFAGFVTEEEKRNLYSRATLFLNPSLKEGWGITNIEANMCGTISVSANVAGLRDSVIDTTTGMLYPSNNGPRFVETVLALLANENQRHTMERQAQAHSSTFLWDSTAQKMRQAINLAFSPQSLPAHSAPGITTP